MSMAKAMYHWIAYQYWAMACQVKSDASAVISCAMHKQAFEKELAK